MIKKIVLKNFRAFEDAEIELSRINLILGPNNSGKSAILSAINLIGQTIEDTDSNVPLRLDGKRVDLGTYKDIIFKNELDRPLEIGMNIEKVYKNDEILNITFKSRFEYRKVRKSIVMSGMEISMITTGMKFVAKTSKGYPNCWLEGYIQGSDGKKKPFRQRVAYTNFIPIPVRKTRPAKARNPKQTFINEEIYSAMLLFLVALQDEFETAEYVGPFRNHPTRTFLFTGAIPSTVGIHGEHAVGLLADDYFNKGRKKRNISDSISKWLKASGIAQEVTVEKISDRHFEVKLKHSSTGEEENLADVGFGCGQVLPILVSGNNADGGSIFIVEQPEIHLHPRAQAELGSFFYSLFKRDIQTIIETHSEHLLLRLQYYVAKGLVKPSDLKIHYVFAPGRSRTKRKVIREITLDEDGMFINKWPEGFFPETLIEARRVAKARSSRR